MVVHQFESGSPPVAPARLADYVPIGIAVKPRSRGRARVLPLIDHSYTPLYLVASETAGVQYPPPMVTTGQPRNLLAYGDNLDVLRRHVASASVDLVYLDPPFNSQADYNVLFAQKDGTPAAAQIKAFGDTWRWDDAAVSAYSEVVEAGGDASRTMQAFRTILGRSDMLAYLSMMAPRLIELRRVLKETGSLYLHCDPTASHYLKVLLDAIFDAGNFQNEIIWYYKGAGISPRRWGRRHDVLFWYGKGPAPYFDPNSVRDPYAETTKARFAHVIGNKRGKNDYGQQSLNPAGKHPDDVWQLPILAPSARERLGYPTQKPESLLARIIKSSSRPNDVVLDPFCGCGTTVAAAERLGRRWIGIDVTHHAIGLIKHRLETEYGPDIVATYQTIGEPTTIEDAAILAREDPYQFQSWSLGLVGARNPIKIGGDGGIDGQSYFHDFDGGPTRRVVYSVKGGHLVPAFVRDLRGVLEREDAEMAVLISMAEPTAGMRAEAAEAGYYQSAAGRFPRLQLRTVRELLAGRGIDRPTGRKMTAAEYEQAALFADAEVPLAPRKPRRPASRRPSAPAVPSVVPVDTSAADQLRADYRDIAGDVISPEEPRSPRKSTRDRTAPLPSPESGDTD